MISSLMKILTRLKRFKIFEIKSKKYRFLTIIIEFSHSHDRFHYKESLTWMYQLIDIDQQILCLFILFDYESQLDQFLASSNETRVSRWLIEISKLNIFKYFFEPLRLKTRLRNMRIILCIDEIWRNEATQFDHSQWRESTTTWVVILQWQETSRQNLFETHDRNRMSNEFWKRDVSTLIFNQSICL